MKFRIRTCCAYSLNVRLALFDGNDKTVLLIKKIKQSHAIVHVINTFYQIRTCTRKNNSGWVHK